MRIAKLNKKEPAGSISEEGVAITPFARGPGPYGRQIIENVKLSRGMN
jgi:hypothetical protein